MTAKRPLLRLKDDQLVPPEEDRRVELAVYDLLLPCRKFEVAYKVATLGQVSPSLEFFLRLIKSVPGISEDAAAQFFGYVRNELAYVMEEALEPGYVERRSGRLWLTAAGDSLFRVGETEPTIFSVEQRSSTFGFDFLSLAPQRSRALDNVELCLPELPLTDPRGTGDLTKSIPDRFRQFFRELGEKRDRENAQRRDLYSIDRVGAADRFQVPVRIRVHAPASNPTSPEVDLTAWRPDHELSDRLAVESAAAAYVDDVIVSNNQVHAYGAYQYLVDLAPDFLREFTTRAGLSVNRYWREAVGRVGEVRKDRKTIALVGSPYLPENVERILSVLDYGLRDTETPDNIYVIAPQIPCWAASTLQREAISIFKRKASPTPGATEDQEVRSVCFYSGKVPRYVERSFDQVHTSDSTEIAPGFELLLVPNVTVVAMVCAAIGASSGYPVPLGFASFDEEVVKRAEEFLSGRVAQYSAEGH